MPSTDFQTPRAIVARFPKLKPATIRYWGRCGLILRRRAEGSNRDYLYDASGIKERIAPVVRMPDKPRKWFVRNGHRWVWRDCFGSWKRRIREGFEQQIPELDWDGLEVVRVFFPTQNRERQYLRWDQFQKLKKLLERDTLIDPEWANREQAFLLGFTKPFLSRYANRDPEKSVNHAALGAGTGRPIKTWRRRVIFNGGLRWAIWYWRLDLAALREETKRSLWATAAEAMLDYGLTRWQIEEYRARRAMRRGIARNKSKGYARLDGRPIKEQKFPCVTQRGVQASVTHYLRSDLERLAKPAPKPGEDGRLYVDGNGRWWPAIDWRRRVGCTDQDMHLWIVRGCPHLPGGRRIRAQKVNHRIANAKGAEVPVYSEADADTVKAALHGWKPAGVAPPPESNGSHAPVGDTKAAQIAQKIKPRRKPGQRGRFVLEPLEEQRRAALIAAYLVRPKGETQAAFARRLAMPGGKAELRDILSAEAMRISRGG